MSYLADLPPVNEDEIRAERREKLVSTLILSVICIVALAIGCAIMWWRP